MWHLNHWFRTNKVQNFKPVILVTGCGSGIGLALADLFYRNKNYRVVVTARAQSLKVLQERFIEDDRFWIRQLDVTSESDRLALISEIREQWQGVNILINNAGISYRAVVEHMTKEDEYHQIATNYFGPLELIRLVLPYMRQIGRGKIINVSSVSGMLAMPTMASYTASKFALEGLSEALWYELKPFGINVSLIQPGFIRSKSFEKVYYTVMSRPDICIDGAYCDYYVQMTPFIRKLMNLSWATPERIANLILKVIRRSNPPLWIPATFDALIFSYLRRLLPRRLLLHLLFYLLPRARTWGHRHTHRR